MCGDHCIVVAIHFNMTNTYSNRPVQVYSLSEIVILYVLSTYIYVYINHIPGNFRMIHF